MRASRRWASTVTVLGALAGPTVSTAADQAAAPPADPQPSAPDRALVFTAAGFARRGDRWIRCVEETPTASYGPGRIDVTDLNGDGRPEAWVIESSAYCYGGAGQVTVLVTRDADGTWRKILDEVGVAAVRDTTTRGWPDLVVGGPGLAPVPPHRWNGTTYVQTAQ